MDELVKKTEQILDQFFRECVGNKLNQFSMLALKEMILNEIRKYNPDKSEATKDVKK